MSFLPVVVVARSKIDLDFTLVDQCLGGNEGATSLFFRTERSESSSGNIFFLLQCNYYFQSLRARTLRSVVVEFGHTFDINHFFNEMRAPLRKRFISLMIKYCNDAQFVNENNNSCPMLGNRFYKENVYRKGNGKNPFISRFGVWLKFDSLHARHRFFLHTKV